MPAHSPAILLPTLVRSTNPRGAHLEHVASALPNSSPPFRKVLIQRSYCSLFTPCTSSFILPRVTYPTPTALTHPTCCPRHHLSPSHLPHEPLSFPLLPTQTRFPRPYFPGTEDRFEALYRDMLHQAYCRCHSLIERRISTIRTVAAAIIASKAETISGEQLLQIIRDTPEDVVGADSNDVDAGDLGHDVRARVAGDG